MRFFPSKTLCKPAFCRHNEISEVINLQIENIYLVSSVGALSQIMVRAVALSDADSKQQRHRA